MKMNKLLLVAACLLGCFCITSCKQTPGQKLDRAIDTTKTKAHNAKEAIKDAYEDTKETAKRKSDEAREDLADKIRPS